MGTYTTDRLFVLVEFALKRSENARNTHLFSNANFENPIKAHYWYAFNCSATQLPDNKSITQV